ncbi:BTB/POZ domain-containing protein 9-like [Adelges cooleyi]|uniref:BTB/POZ domain-containing protein 9-like n=1 Tax=Adelges cooleyi TaxID=133065 RepID=UPI0021800991|nr:BTB/POZ domain-containing protein 9-like [Adelges cooleyi]
MSRLCQPETSVVKSPEYLLDFIDTHALDVFQPENFRNLSAGALREILTRDSFYANELDIFRVVYRWITESQDCLDSDAIDQVLSAVRYSLMSDEELNVNLIYGSQGVLDINEFDGSAMITLCHLTIINKITIMFGDNDSRDYSYYIDVSIDDNHWVRVVDYSDYICRCIQDLWIPKQIVRYIRIVGTKNTVNKKFQLLELSYNTERLDSVKIKNGIVAPKYNVAIESMNATVIEGEPHISRNFLIHSYYIGSKDFRNNKYTWHPIGLGCIRIQLAQPYILSSMRMLLWDQSNLFNSYTVEVSANNQEWVMIINNSKKWTHGWQVLHFKPRPIAFIRITGVRNSIGSFFRCVYFESPAQKPLRFPYPVLHDVTNYWTKM